jgi:PIN domain nuclease of toxin-antitoxin system
MLSASLLSIVQRCGEQKLPKDIKKQYGVTPEGVNKKYLCIVLILPTRCEPFERLMVTMALIAPLPIASGDPVRRRRPTDVRPAGGSLPIDDIR